MIRIDAGRLAPAGQLNSVRENPSKNTASPGCARKPAPFASASKAASALSP